MGHAMMRAGLASHAKDVAARRRARARLAGRAPRDRAGRILRRATGFHDARHRGRSALSGWISGPVSRQVHSRGVVAGARVRLADHLLGVDGRGDHRDCSVRPAADHRDPQRNRHRRLAVREARAQPGPPNCSSSAGSSTRRACTTPSRRCPGSVARHPGTTLTVAGDGTQLDWLTEQARKHKVLKAVNFVGRVDHDELLRLLHRADAAVLPSHYEPFGIVALEAAAAGAPLVTSNAGGLGEAVIDGVTGMSFPPRDVAGLAAAVRDAARRSRRGATSRRGGPGAADLRLRLADRGRGDRCRCTWPPNAVSANRTRAGSSSSGRCRTGTGSRPHLGRRLSELAGGLLAFDVGQVRGQFGALGRRGLPVQLAVRTTLAGAPTAMRVVGHLALARPRARRARSRGRSMVPRRTVTLAAIQVSGPIRTGLLTMPWSLIGSSTSVHLVVEVADVAPVGHQRGVADLDVEVGVDRRCRGRTRPCRRCRSEPSWQRIVFCRRCAPSGRSPSGRAPESRGSPRPCRGRPCRG